MMTDIKIGSKINVDLEALIKNGWKTDTNIDIQCSFLQKEDEIILYNNREKYIMAKFKIQDVQPKYELMALWMMRTYYDTTDAEWL